MNTIHGGDIYTNEGMLDFSSNVNPYGPSKAVLKAAKSAILKMDQYPDPYCRDLRRVVAEKMQVEEEKLIFGNGVSDLIYNLVLAEKPKKALICEPVFSEYENALRTVDCKIQYYLCDEAHQFVLQDDFMDYLEEDLDLVVLGCPNSLTGTIIPKILLRKIMIRCEILKIRLVIDQTYLGFVENKADELFLSFGDALSKSTEKYPSLVLLRSFSKMYAMPGLNVGYAFTHDAGLIGRMTKMRQPWPVSQVAQELAMIAITEETRAETCRMGIAKEAKYLAKNLEKFGIKVYPTRTNFLLVHTEMNLVELLKWYRILIRDCAGDRGLGKGYYRIAVRRHLENQQLLATLVDIRRKIREERALRLNQEAAKRAKEEETRRLDEALGSLGQEE